MQIFFRNLIALMGRKPQFVVIALVTIITVGFIGGARHYAEEARIQAAYDTAKSFEDSIIAFHQYYSKVIVPRIEAVGAEFSIDFEEDPHKFPFPATVSRRFGESLRAVNPELSTSLYSDYPFPHIKDRVLDSFESDSLAYLQENLDEDYFRIEEEDGEEIIRYARPMLMKQDCVDCHNRPEFEFERTWELGEFRGARQVSLPVSEIAPIIDQATCSAVLLAIAAAALGGIMIWPVVGHLHRTLMRSKELARELEETNSELEDANASLKEANRVKATFFSIIAHDLRGPFSRISGLTELMAQDSKEMDRDEFVEFANEVNSDSNDVFNLLDNLLEWSQMQMSGETYDPQNVDIKELAEESMKILIPMAQAKEITIDDQVDQTPAFADKNMIMMVIRNLVGNALKFTPEGGVVTLSSQSRENEMQFSVKDSGIGMSSSEIDSLFDGEIGNSKTGTAGEEGTGLGLQLCKEMLEKNGGTIWAESKPGEGSQFHFTLPIGPRRSEEV